MPGNHAAKMQRCIRKVQARGMPQESARRICAATVIHGKRRGRSAAKKGRGRQ